MRSHSPVESFSKLHAITENSRFLLFYPPVIVHNKTTIATGFARELRLNRVLKRVKYTLFVKLVFDKGNFYTMSYVRQIVFSMGIIPISPTKVSGGYHETL